MKRIIEYKRILRTLAVLLVSILVLVSLPFAARAEEEEEQKTWNSKLFHIGDFCGVMSEDFCTQMNHENDMHIVDAEFDFVVLAVGYNSYGDTEFTEYLDEIYKKNDLGYGINSDGLCLGLDVDRGKLAIRMYGRAIEILSKDEMDQLYNTVREGFREGGYERAVSAFCDEAYEMVKAKGTHPADGYQAYEKTFVTSSVSLDGTELGTLSIVDGQVLPSWYVTDPENFVDFHNDENETRLIDLADLLTPQEEAEIKARLAKIRKETDQDIVIYTDTTSYGMDNERYEMDFYVYNGYGVGPEFDGLMLFINMDPENREMVSTAFGKTREVFTAYSSNKLDDILYEHLVVQDYFGAFCGWTEGVEILLKYGVVDPPEWYMAYVSGENMEARSQVKLVNEVGGILDSDTERLLKEIKRLSEKYDTDIVVYLGDRAQELRRSAGALGEETEEERINFYLDTFWKACGYGFGEDHRGILLGIFLDESSMYKIQVRSYGEGATGRAKTMTEDAEKQLESVTLLNLGSGNYYYNVNRYLSFLSRYLRWGFVPHSWGTRFFWIVLCSIGGLITGSAMTSAAKAKNRIVMEATQADSYMVSNSFRIRRSANNLTGTREERRYIPPPSSSDSGSRSSSSSSHSSSYSSSSSSSSGRSGSSSRRSF